MIKAVIFDNEWVIVKNDWDRVGKIISNRLNVELLDGLQTKKLFSKYNLKNYSKGLLSSREFWYDILVKGYGLSPSDENMATISDAFSKLTTQVYEPIIELIKSLKKNYKVLILSNSCPEIEFGNKLNHSYFDLFDYVYFSHNMGTRKPELMAYQKVLKDHSLKPANTIFIDDKIKNLEAASQIGINTIHFKIDQHDIDYLKNQLKNNSIVFM